MSPERWQQIEALFQSAVELEPSRRPPFLEDACLGDQALRSEVESLLETYSREWDLIDEPALEAAASFLADDQPQLTPGDLINHYEIERLIGRGGMGEVYLATDRKLNRKIALKLLPGEYTTDDDRLRRFQQEAQTASALNHPNILTIYELGEVDGQQFIATEFVEGETIRERMKRAALSPQEALDVAIQAAGALAAAHQAGIVHRDIKPENIMLRPDGYVKVLDFGLAKLTEQPETATHFPGTKEVDVSSGLLKGTVKYMSPEQARGEPVDARSDVFSLGVVLYEMLARRPPFEGKPPNELIAAILNSEPPPLISAPVEVQRLIAKALRKQKEERYQTIEDLLVGLESLKQDRKIPGRRLLLTINVIAAFLLLIIGAWMIHARLSGPAGTLAFNERDWVLISSFDNRTGDPLFDGTIESALERELSNSRFVNVVSPERSRDALRLMKKPPETKIDAELGREICLRDGSIRALVTGRVEKLGTTYVMSVTLVDPFHNQTVAGISEEAANQDSVWPAIRRLSNWTRGTLGETLVSIQRSNEQLEKVTTPSLRALQLYTQGVALLYRTEGSPAEQVLRQALAEDPEFASAYNMLAHALRNQGKPEEEWGPPSQRAFDLSVRTSERERYFIEGSYYGMREEDEKAVSAYEALIRQYPDHFWGHNNLSRRYFSIGRYKESVTESVKAAELRPNEVWVNLQAAWSVLAIDINESRRLVERAAKLLTPELATSDPDGVMWTQFFPIHDLWVQGEIEPALKELDHLAKTIDSLAGSERDNLVMHVGSGYLAFGKLRAAEEAFQRLPEQNAIRNEFQAEAALDAGDRPRLRTLLSVRKPDLLTAFLLARAGLPDKAQQLLSERIKSPTSKHRNTQLLVQVVEGEIALSRGRTLEAITLFERAVPDVRWNDSSIFFRATVSWANALDRQGDLLKAVQVLEAASQQKAIAFDNTGSAGLFWLEVESQLARSYRKLGRLDAAQKTEAELAKMLAHADPKHPLLLELSRSEAINSQ